MTARTAPDPAPDVLGVPLAARPGGHLQVGSSPRSAGVLGPLDADVAARLTRRAAAPLDPDPLPRLQAAAALQDLARHGVLPRARALAGAAGLQEDATTAALAPDASGWAGFDPAGPAGPARLAARRRAHVAVAGCGRTGTALLVVLAAAGVGGLVAADDARVAPGDAAPGGARPADAGRTRQDVALERAGGASPAGLREPRGPADVVVLVEHHVARSQRAEAFLADGVPHLSVVLRDTDALVGPLVLPGRTACLRCLDLHRTDADPGWPGVLAQWSVPPRGPAAAVRPEETASATAVAGLAALQVLHLLDGGRPASTGATLELLLPEGLVQQRPWPPHPACGCTDLPLP